MAYQYQLQVPAQYPVQYPQQTAPPAMISNPSAGAFPDRPPSYDESLAAGNQPTVAEDYTALDPALMGRGPAENRTRTAQQTHSGSGPTQYSGSIENQENTYYEITVPDRR